MVLAVFRFGSFDGFDGFDGFHACGGLIPPLMTADSSSRNKQQWQHTPLDD